MKNSNPLRATNRQKLQSYQVSGEQKQAENQTKAKQKQSAPNQVEIIESLQISQQIEDLSELPDHSFILHNSVDIELPKNKKKTESRDVVQDEVQTKDRKEKLQTSPISSRYLREYNSKTQVTDVKQEILITDTDSAPRP